MSVDALGERRMKRRMSVDALVQKFSVNALVEKFRVDELVSEEHRWTLLLPFNICYNHWNVWTYLF